MDRDLLELLDYIDPSTLDYQEWVNVGMALKHEGYSSFEWDRWSSRDSGRYHPGECQKKWNTFNEDSLSVVTAGTIVKMAKENGWTSYVPKEDYELGWDSFIGDEQVIIDPGWIEGKQIKEPINWNPVVELTTYLETLFNSDENVGYVTRSWEKDGKFLPTKGCYDRTAGKLIHKLQKCNGDIGSVLGDYNPEVGAWIRFNPLDGKDTKDKNVTDYRYALIESDKIDIEKQNAIIRELELPVACLVHSGNKSIHAIVKIEAADYHEYRKRVDFLYTICNKNGLVVDTQNKNPSRLSRLPGVIRNGHKQFLIDTNIGKSSWDEWKEWIESINDDLPDPEGLDSVWDNLPELSPPLIDGVLRQGHKMLIAGPSKAGKSFALIEMCIAIAEGTKWFNWQCAKGKVMYVNLELDRASCLHRFKDVYKSLRIAPNNLSNIDIWNLRGKSIPMDKLAPKLIRRALKKDYIAVVIDPIYKVITGDENSADQMANFCNQFDKICNELGTSVIYCHHHSKGTQGNKRSMDRASGSGVFARDPDALLDLIELELTESIRKNEINKAVCKACQKMLNSKSDNWADDLSQDDCLIGDKLLEYCRSYFPAMEFASLMKVIQTEIDKIKSVTAWRIEGTLREFPKFSPMNLWFNYPIHQIDDSGILSDINPDEVKPLWQKAKEARKGPEIKKRERKASIETAYDACNFEEKVTVQSLANYMGVSERTVRNRLKEHGGFQVDEGIVCKM